MRRWRRKETHEVEFVNIFNGHHDQIDPKLCYISQSVLNLAVWRCWDFRYDKIILKSLIFFLCNSRCILFSIFKFPYQHFFEGKKREREKTKSVLCFHYSNKFFFSLILVCFCWVDGIF